ncbi:MAG: chemotaxis protein CheW [Peptococcaceae bacterium]|jgi:purine-binding chemotaxis protein CheW|nr:chemotaxis protein CheW [Peptococcaceae bacterium]
MAHNQEGQLVIFELGEQRYALPILETQEIMRMVNITRIPNTSYFVEGVINLRGNVIPVINLNSRLGLEKKAYDQDTRIIVVDRDGQKVGMIVDLVQEVGRYTADEMDTGAVAGENVDILSGVVKKENQLWLLLNLNKLLA